MANTFINRSKGALDAFSAAGDSALTSQAAAISRGADELIKDPLTGGQIDMTNSEQLQNIGARQAENGVSRTPWFMSTTEWLSADKPRGMFWNANPSDITWSMPTRSHLTKNLFGTVLHAWPDSKRNTFFDEFRISLTLQSGNIMPVRTDSGQYVPAGGLFNFYDFMQLVDAPKLTLGTDTQPPRSNLVIIRYNSNLFPKLTLKGVFDPAGIRFNDSSQSPTSVSSWTADFIVYDSTPKMSDNTGAQFNATLMNIWKQERIVKEGLDQSTSLTGNSNVPTNNIA